MLKIKDSVDLKELEKFGFKFNKKEYIRIDDSSDEIIGVNKSRYIYFELLGNCPWGALIKDTISIIYDLIQAGLVEKVDDKK